eukprot:14940341-Alexandrium_andersonii.AAC.1
MSASLVGSEMCIRDSIIRVDQQLPPIAAACPSDGSAAAPCLAHAEDAACLLYTSDAADDM